MAPGGSDDDDCDDARVEINFHPGHPALVNDPDEIERVSALLTGNGYQIEALEPLMGGEDFAHTLNAVPGCFWMLGARTNDAAHHTSQFNPSEDVLTDGVAYWLLIATN